MEIILTPHSEIYNQAIYSYNDYIYKQSIQRNQMWEPEIIENMIKFYPENTDVIDVGANIGLISLGFLKNLTKSLGSLHCFECDTSTYCLLEQNFQIHPKVNLYPFALSDGQKLCQISSNRYNLGCNYIYQSKDPNLLQQYEYSFIPKTNIKLDKSWILSVSLDSISYHFTNRIGLIKIDVEGFEYFVLVGAKKMIERDHPVIIVEIWEINIEKVKTFLINEMGYTSCNNIGNENYIFVF